MNVDQPMTYTNTRLAYRRFVERFGPEEFFSMKEWVDHRIDTMGIQQILSFWRLGGYDAEFFIQSARQITSLVSDANDEELADIASGIEIMWSSYYIMEQRYDLALDAGLVLFEMDMYKQSKYFLEISVHTDEEEIVSTVYYGLAVCCFELELVEEGLEYTRKLLELEPDNEDAMAIIKSFE